MIKPDFEYGKMIPFGDFSFSVCCRFPFYEFVGNEISKEMLLTKLFEIKIASEKDIVSRFGCILKYCRIQELSMVRASFDYSIDMRFSLLPNPSFRQRLFRLQRKCYLLKSNIKSLLYIKFHIGKSIFE